MTTQAVDAPVVAETNGHSARNGRPAKIKAAKPASKTPAKKASPAKVTALKPPAAKKTPAAPKPGRTFDKLTNKEHVALRTAMVEVLCATPVSEIAAVSELPKALTPEITRRVRPLAMQYLTPRSYQRDKDDTRELLARKEEAALRTGLVKVLWSIPLDKLRESLGDGFTNEVIKEAMDMPLKYLAPKLYQNGVRS